MNALHQGHRRFLRAAGAAAHAVSLRRRHAHRRRRRRSCARASGSRTAARARAPRRSCSRRSGSTRTRRSATRTTSSSCARRCALAREAYLAGGAEHRVRPFRRALRRRSRRADAGSTRWSRASVRRCSTARCSMRSAGALGVSFYEAMRQQSAGIGAGAVPISRLRHGRASSRGLKPAREIAARHTVGLVDPITAPISDAVDDGLPETLEEVVARYGHRWFKLKVGGDVDGGRRAPDRDRGGARPHRRALPCLARRQRAVRRSRRLLELWRRMQGRAAAAAPGREHRLHRAADQARSTRSTRDVSALARASR